MSTATPALSLIVPTRERADYLASCLATCIAMDRPDIEILVLDNASRDNTAAVVAGIGDRRIRYLCSDRRLSMRDNFERGIAESHGAIIGFIGDDDGVFPFTADRVLALFAEHGIEALSGARAHYAWPDLLLARRGKALLPRGTGVTVGNARAPLRHLLRDDDYYRLPCIYHGFVARSAIDRVLARQPRFFMSGIVDCASTMALSIDDIRFGYSHSPLVINGGSRRSNGASQFGGGSEAEQANWKVEDDLGFLPGFDDTETVGALIVETALRSVAANGLGPIDVLLDRDDVARALTREWALRREKRRSLDEAAQMFVAAGLPMPAADTPAPVAGKVQQLQRLARLFLRQRPVDLLAKGVTDVLGASRTLTGMLARGETRLTDHPVEQVSVALAMRER